VLWPIALTARSLGRTAAIQLWCQKGGYTMKTITAALIALALLSMAAPVNAFDAESFFAQADRSHH
jgi:hypothetical protein